MPSLSQFFCSGSLLLLLAPFSATGLPTHSSSVRRSTNGPRTPYPVPGMDLRPRGNANNDALGLPTFLPDMSLMSSHDLTGLSRRNESDLPPRISADFPDPSLVQDADGKWYSFATSGNGKHIQVATAEDPIGQWTLLDHDALPGDGWTSGANFWAPDVRRLGSDSYIMYFSGQNKEGGHCVGFARSKKAAGPYTIEADKPLICPKDEGGAIDPAGFQDSDGKRYIVYKVDGNAKGVGSPTPIRVQEVDAKDGSTLIGEPTTILDKQDSDGPLVEAPSLIRMKENQYILFYSSDWYMGNKYDIKYAVATSLHGPYTRAPSPLLESPAMGLRGPGGATSSENGKYMAFHSWCHEGEERRKRCMYTLAYHASA